MFVLAQGTISQKGIRDLRDTRANQYRIFSVSCSLQKMLIIGLFCSHISLMPVVYVFKATLNNLEIISVRLLVVEEDGRGRAGLTVWSTQSRTSHNATVPATLHHMWKPCFTDLYISLTVSLSVDAEEHVTILMNPFSLVMRNTYFLGLFNFHFSFFICNFA